MKKGRKPAIDITPEFIAEVEKLAGDCLNQKQIAAYFGVTSQTWINVKKKDIRIQIAYKKGRSQTILFVVSKLMEEIRANNVTAIIFFLKTQARWSEKNSLDGDFKIKFKKPDPKIDTTDPVEASKVYQSIMTGRCDK
jgi:hypothetical protein